MKNINIGALVLAISSFVFGQALPALHYGFRQKVYWVTANSLFIYRPTTEEAILNSRDSALVWKLPDQSPHQLLPPNYYDGKLYAVQLNIVKSNIEDAFLKISEDMKTWNASIKIDRTNGEPYELYPLKDPGVYLAYNPVVGFHNGHQSGILAIFKHKDEKIIFDDMIDLSISEPIFIPCRIKDQASRFVELNKQFSGLSPFLDQLIRFDGGFALVSKRAGRIWIFSEDTKSIARTLDIYSLNDDQLNQKAKTEMCILAIQPMKTGSLLVATRDEFAFKHAHEYFNLLAAADEADESKKSDVYDERNRSLSTFNDVVWWELNPNTGEKTRYFGEEIINRIQDRRAFRRFDYCFDLDGKVVFGKIDYQPKKPDDSPRASTTKKNASPKKVKP